MTRHVIAPLPYCACCGEPLGVVEGEVVGREEGDLVVRLTHDCRGRCEHSEGNVYTVAEIETLRWLL